MLSLQRLPMLSKFNSLPGLRRSKTTKDDKKTIEPSPSFLRRWRRSSSTPIIQTPSSNTAVVTRSQLKRNSVTASQALTTTAMPRTLPVPAAMPEEQAVPKRNLLSPEYFMDVNLRLVNTNNSYATSTTRRSDVSV